MAKKIKEVKPIPVDENGNPIEFYPERRKKMDKALAIAKKFFFGCACAAAGIVTFVAVAAVIGATSETSGSDSESSSDDYDSDGTDESGMDYQVETEAVETSE